MPRPRSGVPSGAVFLAGLLAVLPVAWMPGPATAQDPAPVVENSEAADSTDAPAGSAADTSDSAGDTAPSAPADDAGMPIELSPDSAPLPITGLGGDAVGGSDEATPVPEKTLADMRADLSALGEALQALRSELLASGPAGYQSLGGTDAIQRMDAIEAEITRLTGAVEEARNRITNTLETASSRAEDLEFRLCDIDPSCDLGQLSTEQMQMAGGSDVTLGTAAPGGEGQTTAQPAVPATAAEKADFERATEALDRGDYKGAADLFAQFAARYPTAALTPEALYLSGEALAASGDSVAAGRAWLEAFSAAPEGARAPAALLGIAQVVAASGTKDDACGFFVEVMLRYPGTPEALDAMTRSESLGCTEGEAEATPPDADSPSSGEDAETAPKDNATDNGNADH